MLSGSTSGVNSLKTANTRSDTSRYRANRTGTTTACGQSRLATAIGWAEWQPKARDS